MSLDIDWHESVRNALLHAARDVHMRLPDLSRGAFLKMADDAWEEECTEAGQARAQKARKAAWASLFALLDNPKYIADQREAEAEECRAMAAAKAARTYPALYQARALGRVLAVDAFGACMIGRYLDETFVPDDVAPRMVLLKEVSAECPESYRAYLAEEEVGYLRLRHGVFRVDFTWHDADETIFSTSNMLSDGRFDAAERDVYLDHARALLYERWLSAQSR